MKRFNGKFNKTVSVLVAASLVFGNNYPYVHADETGEPVEYEEPAGNEEEVNTEEESPVEEEPAVEEAMDLAPEGDTEEPLDQPIIEVNSEDYPLTITGYSTVGTVNYANDKLTVTPPEGFLIKSNSGLLSDEYSETLVIPLDQEILFYSNGEGGWFLNEDFAFSLKQIGTDAVTGDMEFVPYVGRTFLQNLVLDFDQPSIYQIKVDGEDYDSPLSGQIVAESVSVSFSDKNLYSVMQGDTIIYAETGISSEGISDPVTINAEEGNPQSIELTATDKAGNPLQVSFTLVHPKDVLPTMNVEIADIGDIYVGTTYDLTGKVMVSSSKGEEYPAYTGTWALKYFQGDTLLEGAPSTNAPGDYSIKVEVSGDANYKGSITDGKAFSIKYLPLPDPAVTVSGINGGKYAKDSLTLTPKSGYQIKSGKTGSEFGTSLLITEEDIKNEAFKIYMKKTEDGALTDASSLSNVVSLSDVVFDSDDPELSGTPIVDGSEVAIADGDDITAEKVQITVYDKNLSSVETSVGDYTLENEGITGDDVNGYKAVIVFEATEGIPQNCTVAAKDKSGNTFNIGFTLTHPRDLKEVPTVTLIDPANVYVGTTYDFTNLVSVPDDYEGEITLIYRESEGEQVSKPSTAAPGKYSVQAFTEETDKYLEGESLVKNFEIVYLDLPEDSVTVSGVNKMIYAKDVIVLTPTEGYSIKSNKTGSEFGGSLIITEEDCKDSSYSVKLMNNDTSAETAEVSLAVILPNAEAMVFDTTDPVISGTPLVDGEAKAIADGDIVTAEKVEMTVSDKYLEIITVSDGETAQDYTLLNGGLTGSSETDISGNLEFTAVEGSPTAYTVKGYDLSGNEFELDFTLKHPKDLLEELEINVSEPEQVYVGTTYDFTNLVTLPEDYDGTWSLKYFKDGESIEKPDTDVLGTYTFKVVATEGSLYKAGESEEVSFSVDYLGCPADAASISGVQNEKYAKASVVVTPAEGYRIKSNADGSAFSTSLTVTEEDLKNAGYKVVLKKAAGGAQTDELSLSDVVPAIGDVVFDTVDPGIDGSILVDGSAKTVENGDEVVGEKVEITISDAHLYSVETSEGNFTLEDGITGDEESGYSASLVFEAVEGSPKDISITAKDKSGNEFTYGFSLTHPRDLLSDLEIEIAEPGTVFVGTDYNFTSLVTLPDDYEGTWTIKYYKDGEEISKPDTSTTGNYEFKVVAEETDIYREGESELADFSIVYLPMPENALTVSGLKNTYFAKDVVTLIPVDGYLVRSDIAGSEFTGSIELTESDIKNTGYKLYFKASGGAETGAVALTEAAPVLSKVVFDSKKPVIARSFVDDTEKAVIDGSTITAEKVNITISDPNLYSVVATENESTLKSVINGDDENGYTSELAFESDESTEKNCKITATDKSGNEYTLAFILKKPEKDPEPEPIPEPEPEPEPTPEPVPKPTPTPKPEPMPEPLPQPKPEQKTFVKPSLFVDLESQYFGIGYKPVVKTNSSGQLKIEYMNLTTGSGYSQEKPTAVGSYVVRVSVSGDEEFQENTIEKAFDIMFYPAPTVPYSFDGKSGDNGYFVSDVNIVAPEGYTISTSINGPFVKTVPYTGGSQQVYLKHSSGAITSYIAVNQELKIDTVKPVLGEIAVDEKENSVNLSEIVYADHISFNLLDDHLTSVTVNGKPVTVKDNQALVELDATGGKNTFTVTAIDEAGNEYTTEVKLYAAWLRDKVIPAGKKIRLEPGESYNLPSGKWRITGDSTIYNGGTDIYVNAAGEYTFEKVD